MHALHNLHHRLGGNFNLRPMHMAGHYGHNFGKSKVEDGSEKRGYGGNGKKH